MMEKTNRLLEAARDAVTEAVYALEEERGRLGIDCEEQEEIIDEVLTNLDEIIEMINENNYQLKDIKNFM